MRFVHQFFPFDTFWRLPLLILLGMWCSSCLESSTCRVNKNGGTFPRRRWKAKSECLFDALPWCYSQVCWGLGAQLQHKHFKWKQSDDSTAVKVLGLMLNSQYQIVLSFWTSHRRTSNVLVVFDLEAAVGCWRQSLFLALLFHLLCRWLFEVVVWAMALRLCPPLSPPSPTDLWWCSLSCWNLKTIRATLKFERRFMFQAGFQASSEAWRIEQGSFRGPGHKLRSE